jgi:hypothetical protein
MVMKEMRMVNSWVWVVVFGEASRPGGMPGHVPKEASNKKGASQRSGRSRLEDNGRKPSDQRRPRDMNILWTVGQVIASLQMRCERS